jgi:mRNA-degrading endonuclease HigB of HigAB toxin-antitoxin module
MSTDSGLPPAPQASISTAHSTAIHGQPQKSQPAKHPSADILPGNRMVFNLKGNRYRLIVKIHYNTGIVFIRFIRTHADYDKIDASTI